MRSSPSQPFSSPIKPGRLSRPGVMALLAATAFLLGAFACEWALYLTARQVLRDTINEEMLATARLAAGRLDVAAHAKIVDAAQLNDPDYVAVVAPLREMLRALPHIRYIYTARTSPDGIRFAVDAAQPVDADGDGVIDQAVLGEIYEDPDPAMAECFRRGEPTLSASPYADKWGTFMSAFMPVHDAAGRLECVIGVDSNASVYLGRISAMRRALGVGLAGAAVSSALVGAGIFLFQQSRLRSLHTLRLNEARFRGFFDHSLVGMAILSPAFDWIEVNQSLCDILGCTRDELLRRAPGAITHPDDRARAEDALSRILSGERQGYVIENRYVRRDGSHIDAHVNVRCVRRHDERIDHFVAVIVDITASKRSQAALIDALRHSEAALDAFSHVTAAPALATGEVDALARVVTERAAHATGFERVSVWLFETDGSAARCSDLYDLTAARHSSGAVLLRRDFAEEFGAFASSRYVDADDALTDPRTRGYVEPYLKPHGVTSLLDVAIRTSSRDLGLLRFECVGRPHAWEPREISFGCQLADQIGIAILNREQQVATRELMRARDDAQAASRAKSEFLAVMSHEIRTPMNGVIGFANLLGDTPLDTTQLKYVSTIKASAEALLHVINDILDFSKIEAGHVHIDHEPFNARDVIAAAVAVLQPRAAEKKLSLAFDWDAAVPRAWVGDKDRLRQVVLNLAGNAIKFTRQGAVQIRVQPDAAGLARISVIDTGIGIAAEAQGRLFAKFTQADSSTTRRFGGTGLGLAISKQLVELMGGRIGLESEMGRGSTFWFTHSLAPAEPDLEAARDAHVPASPPPGDSTGFHHVLLADDTEINQVLIVEMLKRAGMRVDVVADGADAVRLATARSYDLILMDCQMPVMDGFAATEAIRAHESTARPVRRRTPIIALTADAQTTTEERCRASGMDDFVTKPVRAQGLRQVLQRWLPAAAGGASTSPSSS
ncbi:MAG: response regulator [Opitutaceae bacterium]|nr:response regulator [Opitutaceae bacterium]